MPKWWTVSTISLLDIKSEDRETTVKVCVAFSPHSTSDWITESCHESETLV